MKKVKKTRSAVTAEEIRQRDALSICMSFKGRDKDFLADLMDEAQPNPDIPFNRITVYDIIFNLLQQEYLRRNGAA